MFVLFLFVYLFCFLFSSEVNFICQFVQIYNQFLLFVCLFVSSKPITFYLSICSDIQSTMHFVCLFVNHFTCSPGGVRFDSIRAVEEEIDNMMDQEFNRLISGQVAQFEQSVEEDWVPEELRQLLEEDLQNENEQNLQNFGNEVDPPAKQQRKRQNLTINIDPDALLKRVKKLRNPHKALRKKILRKNHKLKMRAMQELRKRRRNKERGGGRERKNA